MSIVNGLFAGRSGISSHGSAIAVVGDNISNSSTIGYKASRAEFEDLLAGGQTAGRVIGSGSSLAAVTTIFGQGTMEFTSRPLDLAIDGNGFFAVADGAQKYYTRAGNFKVDSAGFIIDQNGYELQGFPLDGSGALEALNIRAVTGSADPTNRITLAGNLDSKGDQGALNPFSDFDETDFVAGAGQIAGAPGSGVAVPSFTTLSDSASLQSTVDVFDSLGQAHTITFFFTPLVTTGGAQQWNVQAVASGEEVDTAGIASGVPRLLGRATMTFDTAGQLTSASTFNLSNIPWQTGSATQSMTVDISGFTQFSASSSPTAINQDGQGVGAVTSVNIDPDGSIFAQLDNGTVTTIGTVALVNFSNAEGLQRIGSNLLQQTSASGEPITGSPASGTFGSIASGSLELSTVDIATEFVKVITLQRGFQASSRIITTIDQLLNEIIQLA